MNDHEIYRKCENFLLFELENLQQALDGAEKTINGKGRLIIYSMGLVLNCCAMVRDSGLEVSPLERNDAGDMRKALEDTGSYAVIESLLSKKVLEQVQNSTQIVVRITTALRDGKYILYRVIKKYQTSPNFRINYLNKIGESQD